MNDIPSGPALTSDRATRRCDPQRMRVGAASIQQQAVKDVTPGAQMRPCQSGAFEETLNFIVHPGEGELLAIDAGFLPRKLCASSGSVKRVEGTYRSFLEREPLPKTLSRRIRKSSDALVKFRR